jgi:hypothetical protein
LRWVHASITPPVFWPERNAGEFVFDGIEDAGEQGEGFLGRACWSRGLQSVKEFLQSFRL